MLVLEVLLCHNKFIRLCKDKYVVHPVSVILYKVFKLLPLIVHMVKLMLCV